MKDDLKRNSVKIILSLIILVIASIAFIFLKPESMASRFKLEYESLNGQKTDDGREYMEVNINNDNKIVYADYKTIFDVLDGTGVIYFGFPECPWCRNAVPILLEAAEESGIKQIYYLNNNFQQFCIRVYIKKYRKSSPRIFLFFMILLIIFSQKFVIIILTYFDIFYICFVSF